MSRLVALGEGQGDWRGEGTAEDQLCRTLGGSLIGLGGAWGVMVVKALQVGPACGQGETPAQTTLVLPQGK